MEGPLAHLLAACGRYSWPSRARPSISLVTCLSLVCPFQVRMEQHFFLVVSFFADQSRPSRVRDSTSGAIIHVRPGITPEPS